MSDEITMYKEQEQQKHWETFTARNLDQMRAVCKTSASKRDIKIRQHLMERSFARGKRYGYDRSRWRGLWRNQIQEYMTAAIQNIEALIRYAKRPVKAVMATVYHTQRIISLS